MKHIQNDGKICSFTQMILWSWLGNGSWFWIFIFACPRNVQYCIREETHYLLVNSFRLRGVWGDMLQGPCPKRPTMECLHWPFTWIRKLFRGILLYLLTFLMLGFSSSLLFWTDLDFLFSFSLISFILFQYLSIRGFKSFPWTILLNTNKELVSLKYQCSCFSTIFYPYFQLVWSTFI